MMTFTCNTFAGLYPVGAAAVVTAENVEVAVKLLEEELAGRGLAQVILPGQLVPMVTTSRKVRILVDGDY